MSFSITQIFRDQLSLFFAQAHEPMVERLLALASLGDYGVGSFKLHRDFKNLGILHLLVLSGSQVGHFCRPLRFIDRWLWGAHWQSHGFSKQLRRLFFVFALGFYGFCVGWPAPLTRALIFEAMRSYFPHLGSLRLCVLVLLLHGLVWPLHLGEMSFYLSWLSFSMLLALRSFFKSELLTLVLMSVLSQILWLFLVPKISGTAGAFLLSLAANVCLGWIFDHLYLPLLGVVLALAFYFTLVSVEGERLLGLLMPSLEGASRLILVATRAFMYTGGHDL